MTFEINEDSYVVFCGESGEGVGLVLKDSLFDLASDPDVENAALAGQDVDVVGLGHVSKIADSLAVRL